MKVIKPQRLSCLTRPYRYLNKDHLAITAVAMVDFSSGFRLEAEQGLWEIFNQESVLSFAVEALDLGIPKRKPEIILNAYGYGEYAVDGRTAVSVSVNNVRKDLWVTGDRYWLDGKPSRALPFEKIAINWRNAYGGPGFDENPAGKGFGKTVVDGMKLRFLPNVEDPAHPVIHEKQRYSPAGYSAIPIEFPGRNLMLGTYDDHWRVHDFPGFARDIDWEYFNQSPERQRLDRLEIGDEISFVHLHPGKERLSTHVPPLVARAFIKRESVAAQGSGFLEDVPLRLTTYWAYPHLEKAILLYQGAAPVDEDDASDISHILYAAEHGDSPKPAAYYEDIFHKRMDPKTGGFHALLDKQLVDSRYIRRTAQDEIEISPLLRNKLRKLEKELEQNERQREWLAAQPDKAALVEAELAGLKKSRDGKMLLEDAIEEMMARQQQDSSLKTAKETLRKNRPALRKKPDDASAEVKDRRERFVRESREELLSSMRKGAEEKIPLGEGAQAVASGATQAQMDQLRLKQLQAFEDLLASAPAQTEKRDYSGKPRRLHRIFGLSQLGAEPLPADCDGYELHDFTASGTSYAGRDFSGLTITESRLSGCDFTKSRMAACDIDNVTFSACDFSSVDWSQAHFRQCVFIDCKLPGVQSDKVRFENCRFLRSELSEWLHFRITLKDCVFEHCRFASFACLRGRLERIAFEHCRFLRHAFTNGKVADLRMESCHIDSMAFTGMAKVQKLRLAQCRASKLYVAPATVLEDIEISHSTISASSFRNVEFNPCRIAASDMGTCDFSEANMQGASLEDSFFNQCLLTRTDLSRASITNSDFSEAQVKAADLGGAHMRHVSFFSAELAMIKADADTIQRDMLMDRANVYPLRK